MSINLSNLSRMELLKLREDVEAALEAAEIRERNEALKAAQDAAAQFGFSLDEITQISQSLQKKAKSKPKYRNPSNPEETWSGRGRKPQWVHEALTAGADISDLEI
ncbi:H-NS histone family protein [Epibacterium ulvae]|uniref:H-NS histone family protein n=1 Tax=Epibacterium ulvae TaxID=1156985 RepID=UPI0024908B57|nr:H-NS histone family protein [Epibacterium ulvae]